MTLQPHPDRPGTWMRPQTGTVCDMCGEFAWVEADAECHACGYTGICHQCNQPNPVGFREDQTPIACSNSCARELWLEANAEDIINDRREQRRINY